MENAKHWYRNKKIIYHSLVESHMIYGIVIWASSLSKNVLNQFSNDDVPILSLPKFDRTTQTFTVMSPLNKKLAVLKLKELYWFHIGINCYEFFKNNEFHTKLKDNSANNVICPLE